MRSLAKRIIHRVLFACLRLSAWLLQRIDNRRSSSVRSVWAGMPIFTQTISARAEQLLGVEAESLALFTYRSSDEFDINLSRWTRYAPLRAVLPYVVLAWAIGRYQRFHFFYNRGFLPQLEPGQFNPDELRLLRALGKQVFVYAYGADVRTRAATESLETPHLCGECPAPGHHCVCDDRRGNENYHRVRAFATQCFSLGDMTAYTPGSRNDLFYWCIDLDAQAGARYRPVSPPSTSDEPIRIVHAANHRFFKGTRYLMAAVEQLQHEGLAIELDIVEGLTQREAFEAYRRADLIFDQCTSGFHGYLSLEAMALGKPVLCFIRRRDFLLHPDECPLQNTSPTTLVDDLRRLAADRKKLHELGQQGRRYIEQYFTLDAFAQRLALVYRELGLEHGPTVMPAVPRLRPRGAGRTVSRSMS